MRNRTPASKGDKLARKLLDDSRVHNNEYHGPRTFSSDAIRTDAQKRDFAKYSQEYVESLSHKCVPQRTSYITGELEKAGYQSFEQMHDGLHITELLKTDPKKTPCPAGTKFYLTFQDDLVIAVNMGRKFMQKGIQFAAAHTDSPHLLGTGSITQEDGLAYLIAEPFGGFSPDTWKDRQLSLFFQGSRRGRGNRRARVDFSIGDNPGEPRLTIPRESYHLGEGEGADNSQLKILIGSTPYKGKFGDPTRNVVLETMRALNEKHGITEKDLKLGHTFIYPSQQASFSGVDSSVIAGFGQDDWACAHPLLRAFLNVKNPTYTTVLQLHPGEETGDKGRSTAGQNFFGEVVAPCIANLRGEDLGLHYEGLLKSHSLWADVVEARHAFSPELHDETDSAFIGGGPVLIRQNGDEGGDQGWRASRDMLSLTDTLLTGAQIPYQVGTMGHPDEKIMGASADIHSSIFAEGIDVGVPLAGMHSINETTSAADVFLFRKAAEAFFSIKDRQALLPTNPRAPRKKKR